MRKIFFLNLQLSTQLFTLCYTNNAENIVFLNYHFRLSFFKILLKQLENRLFHVIMDPRSGNTRYRSPIDNFQNINFLNILLKLFYNVSSYFFLL